MSRESLQQKVRQLNEQRRSLFEEVEGLTDEQLNARPILDEWSVSELLEHLGLAERDVLQGLPSPGTLTPCKRSVRNRLAPPAALLVLRLGIPVEAPSPTMLPRGGGSLESHRRNWDEVRQWLDSYIADVSAEELRAAVFQHPIAGPLRLAEVLRLGYVHVERHRGQVRRLLHQL